MRREVRSTRAGRVLARMTQSVGAGVLIAGSLLVVPATLLLTSAPASAHESLPTGGTLTPSVLCAHQSLSAGVTANGEDGDSLCGTITVSKTDSVTGNGIAGAEFTLYWGPCVSGKPVGPKVETPNPADNPVTTDSTGTATFSPVHFKWWGGTPYCVVETAAPAGYTGAADGQTVTVYGHYKDYSTDPPTETCTAPVSDEAPQTPDANSVTLPQICVTGASFADDPIPVNINISKYGTANTGLNDATFTLETTGGVPVSTGATGVVNGSNSCITLGGTSTVAATCSILNIQIAGTYLLAETSPPHGYDTVPPISVTVTLGTPPIQVIVVDTATVVPTAAAGGSSTTPSTAAVSGATTVHTGEPFAGSAPYVAGMAALGGSLMGLGLVRRRRTARQH